MIQFILREGVVKMKKENLGSLLIVLFALLATGVVLGANWILNLDDFGATILRLVPSAHLTTVFQVVSRIGNHVTLMIATMVIFGFFVLKKQLLMAFWFAGTMALSGTVVPFVLKYLFARPRPMDGLFTRTGYSFPSGHSTGATVFYGLLIALAFMLLKKQWQKNLAATICASIVLLVLWARVYLGFHFSTDVLASLLLGSGQVLWSVALYQELAARGVRLPAFRTSLN